MPEGDTVWNTARLLDPLVGQVLERSDFRVPKLATTELRGATVLESGCRGKHLLLRMERTGRHWTLHSHLRMDGAWRAYRPGQRWTGGPAHLVRAALYAPRLVAVGYHLHDLALVPTDREAELVGHLGPDLLGPDWDAAEAVRRLAADGGRTIGEALLDQRNLAGIGNVYKAEVLFLRGLSPWRPVSAVGDLTAVVELAHRLLVANKGRWDQVTTGSLRRGETHWVYGRRGQPCRRCGTLVRQLDQGERVTYWCPACQPGDVPDAA
ncbi:MAG TPA: DNA-formamidopyrimidine glycosylase family protein [Rugosimonospora sp.]|nr:DNA-formamidopyrimidine glycosylase family protein [Rugosimonospora sp.]